jgi:hypothetical protein
LDFFSFSSRTADASIVLRAGDLAPLIGCRVLALGPKRPMPSLLGLQ